MAISEKKKQYDSQYKVRNIKRVPLDMQKSDYEKLVEAAAAAGMKVNRFIKEAIADKMKEEEKNMERKEARALGWAYGRLERAFGDEYDKSGTKYARACERPLSGFATIHAAAIREHKITKELEKELVEVLSFVDMDKLSGSGSEPYQSLEIQGIWQLAHIRGKSGQDFLAD